MYCDQISYLTYILFSFSYKCEKNPDWGEGELFCFFFFFSPSEKQLFVRTNLSVVLSAGGLN